MKKSFLLLSVGIIALLSACSGDVSEANPQQPIQTEAKLTVTVRDQATGSLLAGAEVTLLSADIKKTTDSQGVVIFNNVRVGEHRLLVKKEDYADTYEDAVIYAYGSENVLIAYDWFADVGLSPKNAELWGYVRYINKNGQTVAADSVKVFVLLNNGNYNERLDSAFTDADGKYEFSKLPAVSYDIWAMGKELGGIVFDAIGICGETFGISCEPLISGGRVYNGPAVFMPSENNSLFEVKSYKNMVKKSEALVFEFTESINKEWFTRSIVKVFESGGEIPIGGTSLSSDGKKLTITPVDKWPSNFEVRFNDLKSDNGQVLTYTLESVHCARTTFYLSYMSKSQCEEYISLNWGYERWNDSFGACEYNQGTDNYYSYNKAICNSTNNSYYPDGSSQPYNRYSTLWVVETQAAGSYPITVEYEDLSKRKIQVEAVPAVPGDSIDYDASVVNLRWDGLGSDSADGYTIYRKIGNGSYVPITQYSSMGKGTGNKWFADNVWLMNGNNIIDSNTVSFMVQAHNATSKSLLELKANVRDTIAPTTDTTVFESYVDIDLLEDYLNSGENRDWLLSPLCLDFNEPMDTRDEPEEWTNDSRLLIKPVWNGNQRLCLDLTVKAGEAIEDHLREKYPLAWLRDRAGNEVVGNINIKAEKQ